MSSRPAGVPEDAREITLDELKKLAETDVSLRPLVEQALAARQSPSIELDKEGRAAVMIDGREIYKWKQTLDEVIIFIAKPPGVPGKAFVCTITADHLTLGIKGNDRNYIDEPLAGLALEDESFMTIEDDTIVIYLQKAEPGTTWASALRGHAALSSTSRDVMQKKLMLERFQREHPGFDFSNAQFTGEAPDVRSFMGGLDYNKMQQ